MTTADTDALVESIRHFVREEIVPLEPTLLQEGFGAVLPAMRAVRATVKTLGFWTPHLAQEQGGPGLDLPDFARVSEALGWSPLGHYAFNCQAPDIGNMELLLQHGSPEQRERWFVPLTLGDMRSCFSMTEPDHAGSNPVHLGTTAVRDGDDYVINGHKWFTSAADGASFAIVMAVTNPDAESPYARASQIIVPTNTPGFTRVRNIKIMGDAGEDYFSHAEVRYDDCRVPVLNRIGAEGAGFRLAQERLGPGRIHHCMRWVGMSERAFDLMCARAAARMIAPGRALAQQQAVQHWIAECRADIDASRLMVMAAAGKMHREGQHAARVDISTIKFFVANVLQRVVDRAIQVHGAQGVTDDTVLSFMARHERGARIYDGPDEVHKSVVARHILRGYGVDVRVS